MTGQEQNDKISPKPTNKLPNGVGEDWPRLLSKKWLAGYYGCSSTNGKRFRNSVLSPEILQQAEIPLEIAYSPKLKTFNVNDSRKLTQLLRGFCLASSLFFAHHGNTQTVQKVAVPDPPKYLLDTTRIDSVFGQCIISDSIVRMVEIGPTGEMRFEKVMSTIVVDALYTKRSRILVRASDGGTDSEEKHIFYFLPRMGIIDPNRILLFKQKQPNK